MWHERLESRELYRNWPPCFTPPLSLGQPHLTVPFPSHVPRAIPGPQDPTLRLAFFWRRLLVVSYTLRRPQTIVESPFSIDWDLLQADLQTRMYLSGTPQFGKGAVLSPKNEL